MKAALEKFERLSVTISQLVKEYRIPRSTLSDKINSVSAVGKKRGRQPVFRAKEDVLAD